MFSQRFLMPRWIRKSVKGLALAYRRVTSRDRTLPDFIIVGAQKAGTSSLFHYLRQHPQLVPPFTKEVHFFDGGLHPGIDNFAKGPAWYRAHFPPKSTLGERRQTFEASPLYLFNPLVPERIHDLVPTVKLIALLRNPTERAISHYFHERRAGHETLPVMEALLAEEQRLAPVIDSGDYKSNAFMNFSYKQRGLYREQLERFAAYFPWSQILVLSSEEFFCDPGQTLRRVFEFVGVDPECRVGDLKPRNVGRDKAKVDPEVYSYLDDYFVPHNQALYRLIGKGFAW
jgi:hypothetical protein